MLLEHVEHKAIRARAIATGEQEREEGRPAVVRRRVRQQLAVWDAKLQRFASVAWVHLTIWWVDNAQTRCRSGAGSPRDCPAGCAARRSARTRRPPPAAAAAATRFLHVTSHKTVSIPKTAHAHTCSRTRTRLTLRIDRLRDDLEEVLDEAVRSSRRVPHRRRLR